MWFPSQLSRIAAPSKLYTEGKIGWGKTVQEMHKLDLYYIQLNDQENVEKKLLPNRT